MPRNRECGIKSEVFNTPLGWGGVAASSRGICRIVLPKKNRRAVERDLFSTGLGVRSSEKKRNLHRSELPGRSPEEKAASTIVNKAVRLLKKYFSGEDVAFDLLRDIRCYTRFQQSVWRAAEEIPYGETRSYAWIAKRIGKPLACRAVGQAMGANPVPVIIP